MEALEALNRGELTTAISLAQDHVRQRPSDHSARCILAELLCLNQELDRADKQLEVVVTQQPQASIEAMLIRQLIRAEACRKEVWSQGRMPEFIGQPDDCLKETLRAVIASRNQDHEQSMELLQTLEQKLPELSGTCNGTEFVGFRDLDDYCSGIVEVLSSTGKYFWIPIYRITSIQFRSPSRPRDLLWRECQMQVVDGPDGVVYLPAIYFHTPPSDSQALLGRTTDWQAADGQPTTGIGQRLFLVGEAELGIMEIQDLQFK